MDFETHTALMNLPKLYSDAVSRNDADAFANVFTDDGVWDAAQYFVAKGRADIKAGLVSGQQAMDWVVQLPVSTLILEYDGQRAKLRTYCFELLRFAGDSSGVFGAWSYTDECAKQPDGRWLLSLHKLHVIVLTEPDLKTIRHLGFPAPSV